MGLDGDVSEVLGEKPAAQGPFGQDEIPQGSHSGPRDPHSPLSLQHLYLSEHPREGFASGSVGKSPPANAGDAGDAGLILGSGRSPGGGHGTHPGMLALRI